MLVLHRNLMISCFLYVQVFYFPHSHSSPTIFEKWNSRRYWVDYHFAHSDRVTGETCYCKVTEVQDFRSNFSDQNDI